MPFANILHKLGLDHITRSSWHVCVSTQRFAWTRRDANAGGANVIETVRPNLPVTGTERGENVYATNYELPQIEPYSTFEMAGLRAAQRPGFFFYLDRHGGNLRVACMRREKVRAALGKDVPVILRGCGNHVQNTIDIITTSTCDADIVQR